MIKSSSHTLVSEESQAFLFYRELKEKSAGKGITILCLVDNKYKKLALQCGAQASICNSEKC